MNAYPHSADEERALLSCCLLGGLESSLEAVETVPLDAFTDPQVRDTYQIIKELATAGADVNPYTVGVKWKERQSSPLPIELLSPREDSVIVSNLHFHAAAILELWRKRRIMEACATALNRAEGFTSDQILADLDRAIAGEEIMGTTTFDGRQCTEQFFADLERRYELHGALSGVETGFLELDRKIDGIQYGEQTIIGARPSMGKTALGISVLMNACFKNQVPTLFISLEMSVPALMRRMCSAWAQIPMQEIRRGSYTESQLKQFTVFRAFAAKSPLWITDAIKGISINELCATVRRRVRKHGIKLVVVDYLQKIRCSERQEKKTYEVGEVSTTLRALAVSTGVAMLTLAQLNRESEMGKSRKPRLSDLGDSKQIEQDADTVALIHRNRRDSTGDTELIIAKQRDGEIGIAHLKFNGKHCRFENISPSGTLEANPA